MNNVNNGVCPQLFLLRIGRPGQAHHPWVGDRFLSRLENRLGRRLRALPVGRPRESNEEILLRSCYRLHARNVGGVSSRRGHRGTRTSRPQLTGSC